MFIDLLQEYGPVILQVVGGASLVVAALNGSIAGLDAWAQKTEAKWDDKAVSGLAKSLRVASRILGIATTVLSPLAARKPSKR